MIKAMSRLHSIACGALLLAALQGWLTYRDITAVRQLEVERADLARLKAKPDTPQKQLAHFVEHCSDSMISIDLKKAKILCSDREGDGFGSGPMIVCSARQPEWPSNEPPGWVVCDKTGCSWSVRNGVGP